MVTDNEIFDYIAANEGTPDKIAGGMKQYGVGADDIFRVMSTRAGKTVGDIRNYAYNSGNADLRSAYDTWAGVKPVAGTVTGPGTPVVGNGTTNSGQGKVNTADAVNLAQAAATHPATDPANATNPAVLQPASLSDSIKELLSGLSIFQPQKAEMPTAPAPFTPTQAQLDGIDSSKRIDGLLSANSPVLQQALARANASANSKGLLNSSMANEAGTQAMISEAAGIANNDANRFGSLINAGIQQDTTFGNTALSGQVQNALKDNQNAYDWQTKLAGVAVDANKANTDWAQKLQGDAITRTANREDTASANAYADKIRQEGYARADTLTDRTLQQTYASDINTVSNNLAAKISSIQNADLPPEVKQAQIASETAIAQGLVDMKNTIYTNLPTWQKEWSTLGLKVGG